MLKKYKNHLLCIVKDRGFKPEHFRVEECLIAHPLDNHMGLAFSLLYLKTPLYFKIWNTQDEVGVKVGVRSALGF